MNKYSSIERMVWGRTFWTQELNLDGDTHQPITIPKNSTLTKLVMLSIDQDSISPHSNLVIKRAGVFSNYADGLVRDRPCNRMYLGFDAYTFRIDPTVGDLQGTVSAAGCSFNLTGAGASFDTELADGDFISLGAYVEQIYGNPAGANAATIISYPAQEYTNVTATKLEVLGSDTLRRIEIGPLNYMHTVDEYITPDALSTSAIRLGIRVQLFNTEDIVFLTHSIATEFFQDLEDVYFDVCAEIEYTARG